MVLTCSALLVREPTVEQKVMAQSDESEISLYIITTCSNIQVMRIKKVITKDEMS